MMKRLRNILRLWLWSTCAIAALFAGRDSARGAEPAAAKEISRTLILAHYMPWFEADAAHSRYGWHWTMNAFHPEKQVNGQPEIAAHYHPLIGAYDSGDPDVLEYHTLLMNLAGIDGVIIDWYGTGNYFDYASIHRHSTALFSQASKTGLKFAVCYEDQTIPNLVKAGHIAASNRVSQVQKEIRWLQDNWFNQPAYLKLDHKPVLLSFGAEGLTDAEWIEVFKGMEHIPAYFSLHHRKTAAIGVFGWPLPQQGGLKAEDAFYARIKDWPTTIPCAFPRFHDIYAEAKVQRGYPIIPDDDGRTLTSTLERALRSGAPAVQIATWNDWGEGTIIEPSVEFGFRDLEIVQRLSLEQRGDSSLATPADLKLPLRLFQLRKKTAGKTETQRELDQAASAIFSGDPIRARKILDKLEDR